MHLSCDVLVVGAGAAGLRAALSSARFGAATLLVAKGAVGRSGATFHPAGPTRGMQVALTPAEVREHVEETLVAALGAADPGLVEVLCGESAARFRDLVDLGVRFRRAGDAWERHRGCFGEKPRAVIFDDLPRFASAMIGELRRLGVTLLPHAEIGRLAPGGARGITRSREELAISCRAVVLAAGGGAGVFPRTLTSPDQVGSALALAPAASTVNLEFIQLMLGTTAPELAAFLPLDQLADAPDLHEPVPRNSFALRTRHLPFSARDGGMWVDLAISRAARTAPLPLRLRGVEHRVAHFAHAMNGGLRIDGRGATTVAGVFACGEAAGGVHGADRIGGNMLAATQVFGHRAGVSAAAYAGAPGRPPDGPRIAPSGLGVGELREIRAHAARALATHAMIPRRPDRAAAVADALKVYEDVLHKQGARDATSLWAFYETEHALACARGVLAAIASRPSTLGPHYVAGRWTANPATGSRALNS